MSHDFGQTKTPRIFLDFTNYYIAQGGLLKHPDKERSSSNTHPGYEYLVGQHPNYAQKFSYLDPGSLQDVVDSSPDTNIPTCVVGYGFSETYASALPLGDVINYVAILSHELDGDNSRYGVEFMDEGGRSTIARFSNGPSLNSVPFHAGNGGDYNAFTIPNYGSTIQLLDNHGTGYISSVNLIKYQDQGGGLSRGDAGVGAVSFGKSFVLPQSPDMSITVTREYDVQNKENMAGKSYSIIHNKGASFGHGEQPFAVYRPVESNVEDAYGAYSKNPLFNRSGRRVWDLSFSQIASDDMFHAYESSNYSNETVYEDSDIVDSGDKIKDWGGAGNFPIPVIYDNPIMSIWTMTQGGRLPFIWQPNKDDWTPNGFVLCKLDSNSFSVVQESFGRYSCELSIREIW